MTADLKPCPFCGCTTIKRVDQDEDIAWYECAWCQVAGPVEGVDDDGQPQGWNTRAPTVSDTGPGTSGLRTPQPGEAPVSSAPAPTMADLIDNLMHIEMLTATGDGLDPTTTIDVHLLAGIGRAVEDDAAWHYRASASAWQPIETAPRDGSPIVAWFGNSPDSDGFAVIVRWDAPARHRDYPWIDENGRFADANITHWMPLPAPPGDSSAAPSAPVDNKISADPVGKEG